MVTDAEPAERARLVLISPPGEGWSDIADRVTRAIGGGDIASIILWPAGLAEDDFQRMCEAVVPKGQAADIAMMVAGEPRIARRVGADGFQVEGLGELALHADGKRDLILGATGARTRHDALEIGELRPDYILFGRLGYDTKPEPHPRNLALAEWWSSMVEIPCIVMAGSRLESIAAAAATGAEFVAASSAIFAGSEDPGEAVRLANRLLDEVFESGERTA
jgi:thiamine-phosphate pyrophosphorylase